VQWLRAQHGDGFELEKGDIVDARAVRKAMTRASEVYHLSAQVAVTTSLDAPLQDFDINARGTLNVLEAARAQRDPPPIIFTSTNKVYGALTDIALVKESRRYLPADPRLRESGIDESRPLDFHSPYGCSKGAADQYVLDYARCFGLRTVVFRMSCIYGPHQYGNEDQGWVAHFMIRAFEGQPITIYGDGCQVRDVLFVEDLVEAFQLAMRHIDRLAGQAFNVGGGPQNTLSLLELVETMAEQQGLKTPIRFAGWRSGDQRYFVSNPGKLAEAIGWRPRTSVPQGLRQLHDWLRTSRSEADTTQVLPKAAGQ
jgi:CDP-paratose 2-epimerase